MDMGGKQVVKGDSYKRDLETTEEHRTESTTKHMYINAHSLRNKQEKLELHIQWHNCDSVGLPEVWWDNLHNWNAIADRWTQAAQERQAGQMR